MCQRARRKPGGGCERDRFLQLSVDFPCTFMHPRIPDWPMGVVGPLDVLCRSMAALHVNAERVRRDGAMGSQSPGPGPGLRGRHSGTIEAPMAPGMQPLCDPRAPRTGNISNGCCCRKEHTFIVAVPPHDSRCPLLFAFLFSTVFKFWCWFVYPISPSPNPLKTCSQSPKRPRCW